MRTAGLRSLVGGSALVCAAVAAGAALAARSLELPAQVWTGSGAGLLLGLAGLVAAALCLRRAERGGNLGFWGIWAAGLGVRGLVMIAAALVFWRLWPTAFAAPMLSMAAAWLVVHFWEIGWLCSRLGGARLG